MKKIICLILLSTLFSCSSEDVSTQLIENNEYLINESLVYLEIRNILAPIKVNSSYNKMQKLYNEYEPLIKKIETNQAGSKDIILYLKLIENLGLVRIDLYDYRDFSVTSKILLKYQIQNITLQAIQNLKFEFHNMYYSSYKTNILTIKKGNVIELYPITEDTLYKPYILVGKLKENANEFSESFIKIDSKNKITTEQLAKIGLKNNIEGLIINSTFEGEADTIRFKKLIK